MNALFTATFAHGSQCFAAVALLALSSHSSIAALADYVVRFDTADHTPSPHLQIGGVSITASSGGQVGTQSGSGLGLDGVGALCSLDVIYGPWEEGQAPSTKSDGWITLQTAGSISSLTVMPHATESQPEGLYAVLFSREMKGLMKMVRIDPSSQTPITIDLAGSALGSGISTVSITVSSVSLMPRPYDRSAFNAAPSSGTYAAGFAIQGLQFRAAHAPEPTSLALLGTGTAALVLLRRRARHQEG